MRFCIIVSFMENQRLSSKNARLRKCNFAILIRVKNGACGGELRVPGMRLCNKDLYSKNRRLRWQELKGLPGRSELHVRHFGGSKNWREL